MSDHRLVYTTWPNPESAAEAARLLVEERLAACANILPGALSFFWWENEVQGETEVVVIFKTQKSRAAALFQKLKELHPYDQPAFVSLDIEQSTSSGSYLSWISRETDLRGKPKR